MGAHSAEPMSPTEPRNHGGSVATRLREEVLHPSMESTCHNLDQYDPSPEADSILEHLEVLVAQLPDGPTKSQIEKHLAAAIASNLREGGETRRVSGAADRLVAELRSIETNGVRRAIGAKSLARGLRAPLAILLDPAGRSASELVRARRQVFAVIGEIPAAQLRSRRLRHELAKRKFDLLQTMIGPGRE